LDVGADHLPSRGTFPRHNQNRESSAITASHATVGKLDISGRHSPEYTVDGYDDILHPKASIQDVHNQSNPSSFALAHIQTLMRDYIMNH
jgi:hypothetical protein